MKAHTSNFKEQIKTMGRELDSKITYTLNGVNVELGKEQLNSITPTYQGALLKSVMKELDIDSNVYMPEGTLLNYQFGVKVNGEYEYLGFGNYVVYKAEKQEDTNSYKLTCYDKMLYSMIDYEKMDISYPITIRDYIKAICDKLGLTFANTSDTFANYDKQIQNELYLDEDGNSLGYTFRDVLDELSQVTASCICINENDELEIRYINDTNDTIDEEFLKDVNVNFGEKFGAINTIVLSRSAESDNVYYPETLPENPYELKIVDNQIMNGNDRSDYLPDIYSKLNGLEFYINDFSSTGICYYELLDKYNVKIGDNTYPCIMLNDEINITQGLEENVYTEMPEETETDYTKADKTDRKINQAYIMVDKQNQIIKGVISKQDQLELDTTTSKTATGNPIEVTDAGNYPLESIGIEGKSEQETRSGKNLWKLPKTQTLNGVTLTNNGDGTITLNGTATANADFYAEDNSSNYTNGEKYYISSNINKSDVTLLIANYNGNTYANTMINSNQTMPFTMNTTNDKVRLIVRVLSGKTFNNTKLQIQLEKGSTATDFEPYGASPSPDYPSEIKTVKGIRNLINDSLLNNGYTISGVDGSISYDASYLNNRFASEQYIKVYNGMKLFSNYQIVNYGKYDNNKNFISRVATNSATTINIDFDGYIRIGFINVNDTNLKGKCMVCEKYLPNNYIPYGSWLEQKTIGKNKFNKDKITKVRYLTNTGSLGQSVDWAISDYIDVIGGTNYTYQGLTDVGASPCSCYYDKDKKFISSFKQAIGVNTITIPSNAYYVRFSVKTSVSDENTFQFEKGNATEYEPYKENIALIDMNKPQLFNNNMESGAINSNGIDYTDSNYIRSIDYIEVEPNTKYNISNNSDIIASNIVEYTENKTFIKRTYYSHSIFTTSANTKYIRFYTGTVANYLFQIYEGYDSYYELSSIGDTKDTFKDGVLTQNIPTLILTGDENFNVWGNQGSYSAVLNLNAKYYESNLTIPDAKCTHFKIDGRLNVYNGTSDNIFSINNTTIYIRCNKYKTLTEFKSFLKQQYDNGTPVTVYYVLAEPQTYQLPYEPLTLHKGYNNITLNDDLYPTMNIEYLTDSKLNAEFTTKSEFNISNNSIRESVSAEIKELDKKTEASLELKVNEKDMMSQINAKADEINFKSNKMTIETDDFKLKDGVTTQTGGNIAGFIIDKTNGFTLPIQPKYDYTIADVERIQEIVLYELTPTAEELEKYDINRDGEIDFLDGSIIVTYILAGISHSNPGKFQIKPPNKESELLNTFTGFVNKDGLFSGFSFNGAKFPSLKVEEINIYPEKTLYENSSGSLDNTITLNDESKNYKYIEIYAMDNAGNSFSNKCMVDSSGNANIDVFNMYFSSSDKTYYYPHAHFTITGNKLNRGDSYTSWIDMTGSGITALKQIKITKVVGIR